MIKHRNSLFQQPHLRQALDVPYRRPCKDIGLYRVPLRQPDDLRRAGCKVKSDFSSFAVVVRLIQVDNGGYFLFLLRHSVCFSVTVWTSLLSSSFRRSLSSVRR